jgi:DNA mismatch repair protein MutL
MADIIKLLPDHVANQIAAGEVIQRPASVVKELLENAIDAKAGQVQLIVATAGKTLIQVIDDGSGMSSTDARMSLERQATSKISNADDLFEIKTKGFRGEAMASIAAIAHLEIKSRQADDKVGIRLYVEGTELKNQEACQCPVGTSVSVKNLFFNVPARRKFLKRDHVEMKHILEEFHRVALVHTDIQFSLHHNGEEVYNLRPSNLRQRTVDIFGKGYNEKLVPIEESTSMAKIHGFVGKPEFAKKTRGDQYFFVNGRFVRSGYLHHAVSSAYEDLLKEKSFPAYFIHIEVDPSFIDINIHPTKTEVKFEDERAVYAIIRSATRQSLGKYNIAPALDFEQETTFNPSPTPSDLRIVQPGITPTDTRPELPNLGSMDVLPTKPSRSAIDAWDRLNEKLANSESPSQPQTSIPVSHEFSQVKTKGLQLLGRFVATEWEGKMLLIDQRRAHERVLYEQLIKDLAMNRIPSQQQLFPIQVELNSAESHLLKQHLGDLMRLGIEMEEFGQNSFVVRGMANYIPSSDLKGIIEELIECIETGGDLTGLKRMDRLAQRLAFRSSKRNRNMSEDEITWLITELMQCNSWNRTPGGSPIVVEFSEAQLNKLFEK